MSEILKIIRERHSSRGEFDPSKQVPKDKLGMIIEAARWAPTAHNMQNFDIVVLDDKKVIETIGKIRSVTSEEFIRENFEQMSMTEEELQRKMVGILGTQFPPKWRDASKLDEAIKERTPSPLSYTIRGGQTILLVFYDARKRAPASEGDFLGILSLGCVMENIWLAAESMGIGVQIVSSLGSPTEAKKILGIPENLVVAFSIRLGYPISEPPKYLRVRRDVDDFTHANRYVG